MFKNSSLVLLLFLPFCCSAGGFFPFNSYRDVPSAAVWRYGCDTAVSRTNADTVPLASEYTVFAVLRTDSASVLWQITERDSVLTRVTTTDKDSSAYDFSDWGVFMHYQGCSADTLAPHVLQWGCATRDSACVSSTHVAEYMYFPEYLPRLLQAQINTSLGLSYGITLDKAPYISFSGDTLWTFAADGSFYHRVTGIGYDGLDGSHGTGPDGQWPFIFHRDTGRCLHGSPVGLFRTDRVLRGEALCGDDDAPLVWHEGADALCSLSRTWQLRSCLPSCGVSVDAAALGADSLSLILVGSAGELLQVIEPDSTVNSKCYFNITFPAAATSTVLFSFLTSSTNLEQSHGVRHRMTSSGGFYASGVVSVAPPAAFSSTIDAWRICDAAGRLVTTVEPADGGRLVITSGVLPTGVYEAEALSEMKTVYTTKIVIP